MDIYFGCDCYDNDTIKRLPSKCGFCGQELTKKKLYGVEIIVSCQNAKCINRYKGVVLLLLNNPSVKKRILKYNKCMFCGAYPILNNHAVNNRNFLCSHRDAIIEHWIACNNHECKTMPIVWDTDINRAIKKWNNLNKGVKNELQD